MRREDRKRIEARQGPNSLIPPTGGKSFRGATAAQHPSTKQDGRRSRAPILLPREAPELRLLWRQREQRSPQLTVGGEQSEFPRHQTETRAEKARRSRQDGAYAAPGRVVPSRSLRHRCSNELSWSFISGFREALGLPRIPRFSAGR